MEKKLKLMIKLNQMKIKIIIIKKKKFKIIKMNPLLILMQLNYGKTSDMIQ